MQSSRRACIWLLAWCNKYKPIILYTLIHQHLFSDFSPFNLPVKQKEKQWKMKEFTMTQWINLNWNNRSVLAHWHSVLKEKNCTYTSLLVCLMAGRQAGRQMKYGWILTFLKFSTGWIIWTFILFNITTMLLQC